jgi:glutathione S-transferase
MADLILHHYPNSPFSEKIRLILGYKQFAWKSVVIPALMPKPDVVALTGGYRKTPFMQVGADIFCDSALISDVLEHLQPTPSIYPEPGKGLARTLAQWADSTLFWAAMAHNLGPKGAAHMFAGGPPEAAMAFSEDRKAMSAGMVRLRPADAAAAYKSYLRRLSCSARCPASPTFLPTIRCGSHVCAHPWWPISCSSHLPCWTGWTACMPSGRAAWKSSTLRAPLPWRQRQNPRGWVTAF